MMFCLLLLYLMNSFHWLKSSCSLVSQIPENTVDVASLIFVLSAIHPDNFIEALINIRSILKPDGVVVFRDYGLHDMAQIRFGRGNKLAENFYVRQDGTRYTLFQSQLINYLI